MAELKPCPFCGGNPIIRSRYVHGCANRKHFKYECAICHASFNNWFKTEFKAAEFWNRRLNMTIEEKLTYIQGQCLGKSCADCKLDNGTTCPKKIWEDWTDEEIETAYSILFPDSKEPEFVKVTHEEADAEKRYAQHKKICDSLNDTYRKKNADYGNSFGKGFAEYGMLMPVIRLEDKFSRFKRLALNGEQNVKDESIKDTLLDLANYALMTIVEMEAKK